MIIAGVDEVGVGCLAGPVVASCVILPEEINEIFKDSKSTSESLRSKQFQFLRRNTFASIGVCTPHEIDELNILNATHLAMKRAIIKLKKKPSLVLIDGNKSPNIKNYNFICVIKGDQKIPSISAASIIAKVTRDKMITNLGKKFRGYCWDKNYGYGTKQHLKAIKTLGVTSHHRKTFSPINKIR